MQNWAILSKRTMYAVTQMTVNYVPQSIIALFLQALIYGSPFTISPIDVEILADDEDSEHVEAAARCAIIDAMRGSRYMGVEYCLSIPWHRVRAPYCTKFGLAALVRSRFLG